jgi:hypothetical protein
VSDKRCPRCAAAAPADSLYCEACGARLDGDPAPAASFTSTIIEEPDPEAPDACPACGARFADSSVGRRRWPHRAQ